MNVNNDERVLTVIKEREQELMRVGFDLVIGLRDMYSSEYRKLSRIIDENVHMKITQAHQEVIEKMAHHGLCNFVSVNSLGVSEAQLEL